MKILFLARHFGYLRNFESAIRLLAQRGHRICLAADRPESIGGKNMVKRLAEEYPSISIGWTPDRRGDTWLELATKIRLSLDYLRYLDVRYDNAPKLRLRAKERALNIIIWLSGLPIIKSKFGLRLLAACLWTIERAIPNNKEITRFLENKSPDVVLLTPLIDLGSPQLDHLKSAKSLGLRTALCVGSWDHLSSKALIRILPDLITVWNETQKKEAIELHGVPPEKIFVTGAQCYDQWFDWKPNISKEEFCKKVGLSPDKPFFLYVCSAPFRGSPSEAEFVKNWVQKIRSSHDPQLQEVGLLIRPHPARMKEWMSVDLSEFQNVTVWGGANPVDLKSRSDYFNSMFFSTAVVGLNTSALIEAGVVGQPVHTLLVPKFRESQEGTIHFHYLMNINGGLLYVARNFGEHLSQLSNVLSGNIDNKEKNRRFIEAFVRPHGMDVPSTPVFVDTIEYLGEKPLPQAEKPFFWLYPVRLGLRFFLYVLIFARKTRKWLRDEIRRRRKKIEKRKKEKIKRKKRKKKNQFMQKFVIPALRALWIGFRHTLRVLRKTKKKVKKYVKHTLHYKYLGVRRLIRRSRKKIHWFIRWRIVARLIPSRVLPNIMRKKIKKEFDTVSKADYKPKLEEIQREMDFTRDAISQLGQSIQTILVGPWLGEIGFELLYWIPFLNWAKTFGNISDNRIIVISRGGVSSWYQNISKKYFDIFDYFTPDEFRAKNLKRIASQGGNQKQMSLSRFDHEIINMVCKKTGIDKKAELLHPSLMYNIFRIFWRKQAPISLIESFTSHQKMTLADSDEILSVFPDDYVAVKFYTNDALSDKEVNQAFILSFLKNLTKKLPVVLLETGFTFDEHGDFKLIRGDRLHTINHLMNPSNNLDIQTRVIRKAKAFIGTYGGFSYLAPLLGVDTVAFYSKPKGFRIDHLELAQRVFKQLECGSFLALDIRHLDLLRLTLGIE